MSIFNTQNRLLLGKNEASFGVPIALTPAVDSDVRVRDLELSTLSVEYDDESSKFYDGTLTHDMAIAGIARGTIDFSIKVAPGEFHYTSGAVLSSNSLPYNKYMKSAGLKETYSAPSTSAAGLSDGYWLFEPNNSELCSTSTIAIYDTTQCGTAASVEYKLGGAMANSFTLASESAGKPYIMNFSMNGKVVGVSEVLGSSIPAFNESGSIHTIASKMLNTNITITKLNSDGSDFFPAVSESFCTNTLSLDAGLALSEIMCQSDSSGLLGYQITGRDERITIDPLLEKISDFDFWSAMTTENPYKLEIVGQGVEITVPYGQIITSDGSDDNGLRRLSITMRPLKNIQGATDAEQQAVYSIKIYGWNIID